LCVCVCVSMRACMCVCVCLAGARSLIALYESTAGMGRSVGCSAWEGRAGCEPAQLWARTAVCVRAHTAVCAQLCVLGVCT